MMTMFEVTKFTDRAFFARSESETMLHLMKAHPNPRLRKALCGSPLGGGRVRVRLFTHVPAWRICHECLDEFLQMELFTGVINVST